MPEEPEYLSLKEAAEYLGIKRASIYYYIKALSVKPEKFEHNKNAYLPIEVVKRMKKIKEQPWKAKEVKSEQSPPPQQAEYQIKPVKHLAALEKEPLVSDFARVHGLDISQVKRVVGDIAFINRAGMNAVYQKWNGKLRFRKCDDCPHE